MAQPQQVVGSLCPVCRSRGISLSGFHGILERFVLGITKVYPFWCNACHRRFFLFFPKSNLCDQEFNVR
jgi:hypothetical protein